ncbi:hypothetical protein [Nocardia terpenica]|uniref:hypothetical protein n=1 Tax=Nocardia terpenica TaxID=455432 RepID=UPI001EEBF456|nr:hypothetical protein [Nocardia terpenica]
MHSRGGTRTVWSAVLAATTAVTLLTGCSARNADSAEPAPGSGPAPASAALAPVPAAAPTGTVTPAAPIAALLSEPATGRLAELDGDGVTVRLLDPATGDTRTATLPAPPPP